MRASCAGVFEELRFTFLAEFYGIAPQLLREKKILFELRGDHG
jgi:hypothetical protein